MIEQAEIKNIANFELTEIQDQVRKKKNVKGGKKNLFISKPLVLIYAHLFRMKIDQSLEKEYEYVIELIPKMCASMVDISVFFSNKYTLLRLRNMGRRQLKFMGIRCISSVLEFCQMVVQGLWEKDKDVIQIQFFAVDAPKFIKNQKYPEFRELVN